MECDIELARRQMIEDAAFTVVVPVRNRAGARLRNCVKSITLQTIQPLEIIIADYGSTTEGHREVMKSVEPFDCSVYYYPTSEIWSLAIARNMGIRRSSGKHVAVVDADLLLESRVIEALLDAHLSNPESYISCFIRMLKSEVQPQEVQMPEDFSKLKLIDFWPSAGWGGLVSATRSWYFKVRGFDERMKFWGAEDADLWKRAGLDGLDRYRLNELSQEDTAIYHQFHSDCLSWDQSKLTKRQADQIKWNKMITAKDYTIIRNNERWGLWGSASKPKDRFLY